MDSKWRNRDWLWLVSILIGVIIIVLTWRLNDNDSVVNIIAMFSSGASIILAIIAIVQSTIYNNSANELNIKMTDKLSTIETNSKALIDNFLNDANKVIDSSSIDENSKEEIKDNLESSIKSEMLMKNNAYSEYFIEEKVFLQLKKVYSPKYKIKYEYRVDKVHRVDFKLENDKKIILIEIKYIQPQNIPTIRKAEQRLNEVKSNICESKEIIPIIMIIVDTENDRKKLENKQRIKDLTIGIIILTKGEVVSENTELFEEQTECYLG